MTERISAEDEAFMELFSPAAVPGYARFRIPGVTVCGDGTLLAYCEARKSDGDWAEIDILLRRSADGGRTFSDPAVLACGTKTHKTVNNPVMIAEKTGTVHFLYCVEYGLPGGGGVFYRKSADRGLSWSRPRDITAATAPHARNVFALGPGHGIALANGTLFVPCWTVLKKHGQAPQAHHPGTVCALTSRNGGADWQILPFLSNGDAADPNETAAAQLPDGSVVLSIRNGGAKCRCYSASRDGTHFSPIRALPEVPDPICAAGLAADGERLYLSHCRHTEERRNLTLEQSDNGVRWRQIEVIDPGNAGYSDLAVFHGYIYVLYEKEKSIVLHTLPTRSACGG